MIVLIGAEKGGVGKSTIATNLSVHLATMGADVVLVDADPQATSAKFVERRNENKDLKAVVNLVQRTGDINLTIKDLQKRYGYIVIDAGGRDSRELRSGMVTADLLLTPTRASQADLETFPRLSELIGLARSFNERLRTYAVLSMAPTNPTISEVRDAKEVLSDFEGIELADSIIRDRKVYRDALLCGKGVVEMDNSQAKAEIQLLAQEFFDNRG